MEGFNWDAPYYNSFDYCWEQHPNFYTNIQDDGTYTSLAPPYQDWNDTYLNTFDQSWEGHVDYSCDFQGTNPYYGFPSFVPDYPSENFFEQPEPSHSFEIISPSLIESITTFFGDFQSSLDVLTIKMGQLVDELKHQSQGPLPSDNEILICVGKDESNVEKELEIFEVKSEHVGKPSLLPNSEEVLQDAKNSNLKIFAHVVKPSFCDHSVPTVVTHKIVWRNYMIKSSGDLTRSCSLGGERVIVKVKVVIILNPSHFLKMYSWGGEPHPT